MSCKTHMNLNLNKKYCNELMMYFFLNKSNYLLFTERLNNPVAMTLLSQLLSPIKIFY